MKKDPDWGVYVLRLFNYPLQLSASRVKEGFAKFSITYPLFIFFYVIILTVVDVCIREKNMHENVS